MKITEKSIELLRELKDMIVFQCKSVAVQVSFEMTTMSEEMQKIEQEKLDLYLDRYRMGYIAIDFYLKNHTDEKCQVNCPNCCRSFDEQVGVDHVADVSKTKNTVKKK